MNKKSTIVFSGLLLILSIVHMSIYALVSDTTNLQNGFRNLYLKQDITDQSPFGIFDIPVDGSTVAGVISVTGWALDDNSGINVKIYRQETDSLIYIGKADLVPGSRPDVKAAYPGYYGNGWDYSLNTYLLPNQGNGSYTLVAVVTDAIGQTTTLGSKTFTCDNDNAVKPFGMIEAPVKGSSISGDNFKVNGWVLTPKPNIIPTDGSTINIYVDGVNVGTATYNEYRSDIASLFPGYNNSNGAGVHFYLNTTQYADGIHSIQWTATDDAGNTNGIGARYFGIKNNGPEIDITANGYTIASGDTLPSVISNTDFESVLVGDESITHTFKIKNTGPADLTLTGSPMILIDGNEFTVNPPESNIIPAQDSISFSIIFNPTEAGQFNRDVVIASNDADEPSYSFRIKGTGIVSQDSINLVQMYNSTGGADWTNNTNWLSGPLSSWYGIVMNGPYVMEINLVENNLTGTIPESVNNLTKLTEMRLELNKLTGLPNLSNLPELKLLSVNNNLLTFEDLEPNIGVTGFVYSPQDEIGNEIDTILNAGESLTLNVNVGGSQNLYKWIKDGIDIPQSNSPELIIESITDADEGVYTCEISSTLVPDLTLSIHPINVTVIPPTSVLNVSQDIPETFTLEQNYPNPFNPSTKIKFDIAEETIVKVEVYNLLGQKVKTLVDEKLSPGTYLTDFNAGDQKSGIYFYSINAGKFKKTKKMLLIK